MARIPPLSSQFEKETVERIRSIQAIIQDGPPYEGSTRFYAQELSKSLEAGLLLASLQLCCTYLETFVREMINSLYPGVFAGHLGIPYSDAINQVEAILEDSQSPQWQFRQMVDFLVESGVILPPDGDDFKQFYTSVRIPIMHGLTRRFVRGGRAAESHIDQGILSQDVTVQRSQRQQRWEYLIEEYSLDWIEWVAYSVNEYSDLFAA